MHRTHDPQGGPGIAWAVWLWHWGLVLVFLGTFFGAFAPRWDMDMVQKLMIFHYVWEALGLGALHGPLHGKLSPPFISWWYRLTPGTLKYNHPWLSRFLPSTRSYLDVLVESLLTLVFAGRCLMAPSVTPDLVFPLAMCALYEFIFDFGQHMHTYGTQHLHCFVCMCFTVEQGQAVGMQIFLTGFYVFAGWGKVGPWFKYMNTEFLLGAKFNVGTPWAAGLRRLLLRTGDSRPSTAAEWAALVCAGLETLGPVLCLSNRPALVYVGIGIVVLMHVYIVLAANFDVYAWNVADSIWYTLLFGVLHVGFDWEGLTSMHPALALWLIAHFAFAAFGHIYPDHVPYVVSHRHAAGNFSQGVLIIKASAAHKLRRLTAHGDMPSKQGWVSEWFSFYGFLSSMWAANLPNKLLTPLLLEILVDRSPDEVLLLHASWFFSDITGGLRADALHTLQLLEPVSKICGFEPGECMLVWVGSFPSFPVCRPAVSWRVLDGGRMLKQGKCDCAALEAVDVRMPSQCTKLLSLLDSRQKPFLS